MLEDSELILGLSRHLGAYAASPAKAALAQLEFAGQVFEMAWRLRGSGASPARRVVAIGVEAGIGQRALIREVLPALQTLDWIDLRLDDEARLLAVDEHIPPPGELVALAESVIDLAMPTGAERAALRLLRETSLQPLIEESALAKAAEASGDEDAVDALRHLEALNLLRRITADDGREVIFNPHIWSADSEAIKAALRLEDAQVGREVGALLEEIISNPGIPQDHIESTEPRWIEFAVAHGLVQRSLIVTSDGDERAFLFTPHLARDPFGIAHGDPSGHVRQLVGSMIYATTFARFTLYDPAAFVRRLVADGEAGDASPIGTDYPMLETAGIVRVERADRYYKLVLLQLDVAEETLRHLEDRGEAEDSMGGSLRAQRSYVHVERERARLAHEVPVDDVDAERLISALRDATARRRFRGH